MVARKKRSKSKNKSKQNKNANLLELKKALVNDLDDFLLSDQNIAKRKEALAEIDKLIKQDLVNDSSIIKTQEKKVKTLLKKESKKDIKPKSPLAKAKIVYEVKLSGNVLDLRSAQAEYSEKKLEVDTQTSKGHRIKSKFKFNKKTKEAAEEKVKYHQPKVKKITWSMPRFHFPLRSRVLSVKLISFALIIMVLLLPIRGLVLFGRIQTDKDAIWQLGKTGLFNLKSGVLSASEDSPQAAQADFEQALANFSAIQDILNQYQEWMRETSSHLPVIGKSFSLSQNLLQVANNISEAAVILNKNLQNEESLTNHIVFIQQQINQTLPYLNQANNNIKGINLNKLPLDLQVYFQSLANHLPQTVTSLSNLNEILGALTGILGHEQEQRYLLLFQNNNELRATGGFIGSFALVDVYQGQIKNLEVPEGGTYDLSAGQTIKIKSPKALSLINPYFNIWDANWWPDFPTSAQKITWFFQNFNGASIDGVIALNATVLQDLLKVVGPIELLDYGITVSADNIFTVIQDEVEFNYKEENKPKAIIADLTPLVLEKLLNNKEHQKEIITVLTNQLSSKDIQIYLEDDLTQEKIVEFGWSGQLATTNKDYLSVINTNIGGGKTDNDIYQTIDHQAEILPSGEIINTVRVTRFNRDDGNNILTGIDGGNVSYLRFHVPLGSELIEAIGFDKLPEGYFHSVEAITQIDADIQAEENKMLDAASRTEIYQSLDKTVFANWVALTPGETQTVSIKYKVPFKLKIDNSTVNNWWQKLLTGGVWLDNYSLLIQSQSGDKNSIFNSSILLPDNIKVVWNKSSAEDKMGVNNKLVTYSNNLSTDQFFGFIVTTK